MVRTVQVKFRAVDRDKYEQIVNGIKTIETRAGTVKYTDLMPGDRLMLVCGKDKSAKTISFVKHYDSIANMLEELPLNQILPNASDIDEAIRIYNSFPGYKHKIEQYGIVALGLS